ncbi:MAG: hypothetical protein HKN73_06000, partial [Gemmatimonadetes bacterium]|nr:hypothetical protein [Gemmatimonadota bacterium]
MDHALGILEFDRALEFVAKFAASRVGRARIQALRPCTDPTRVDRE